MAATTRVPGFGGLGTLQVQGVNEEDQISTCLKVAAEAAGGLRGLGFRVQGLGFRVQGSGFRV